jgi:hypothetical protein
MQRPITYAGIAMSGHMVAALDALGRGPMQRQRGIFIDTDGRHHAFGTIAALEARRLVQRRSIDARREFAATTARGRWVAGLVHKDGRHA